MCEMGFQHTGIVNAVMKEKDEDGGEDESEDCVCQS